MGYAQGIMPPSKIVVCVCGDEIEVGFEVPCEHCGKDIHISCGRGCANLCGTVGCVGCMTQNENDIYYSCSECKEQE